MSDVDRLNRLLADVRTSLLDKTKRSANSNSSAAGKTNSSKPQGSSQLSPQQLRHSIVESLRILGPISDHNRREARKQFVQWIILGEFGFELANSPEFSELCNKVLQGFAENEALCARLDTMLASLASA